MTTLVLCNHAQCNESASITCPICNIDKYCSQKCIENDRPLHSLICRAKYGDRVRAMCEITKSGRTWAYLHNTRNVLIGDNISIINIFGIKQQHLRFCGVCLNHMNTCHQEGTIKHNECLIVYNRCDECIKIGDYLCCNTYDRHSLCIADRDHAALQLLIFRHCDLENKDILYVIAQILIKLLVCDNTLPSIII